MQAKINQKLLNSKVFNFEHQGLYRNTKKMNRLKSSGSAKARTMMNLHNNEAGRRVSKMQFFTHISLFHFIPLYTKRNAKILSLNLKKFSLNFLQQKLVNEHKKLFQSI